MHESKLSQLETDPMAVADQQVIWAKKWAELYSDPEAGKPPKSAEIILRNPQVYVTELERGHLPKELETKWHQLLDFCDSLATTAANETIDWGENSSGLDKIQNLVFTGRVNADYRASIGDVMRNSSALLAESTKHVPGNTKYMAGNVYSAEGWYSRAVDGRS